jgi:hypothetical protein
MTSVVREAPGSMRRTGHSSLTQAIVPGHLRTATSGVGQFQIEIGEISTGSAKGRPSLSMWLRAGRV